jgi:hypothetical protein
VNTDEAAAMSKEGFFRRWSRVKADGGEREPAPAAGVQAPPVFLYGARAGDLLAEQGARPLAGADSAPTELAPLAQTAQHPPVAPVPAPATPERKLPTLDDVAALGPDSDFSAFVSQGVDKTIQRLAMKKLFADPRFNVLDGLDIYIDDYNKSDPVPAAMLAALRHARSTFSRFLDDDKQAGQGDPGAPPPPPPHPPAPDEPPQQGNP